MTRELVANMQRGEQARRVLAARLAGMRHQTHAFVQGNRQDYCVCGRERRSPMHGVKP